RGEESDADEQLVRGWAEERGIVLHCISFDTAGYAREHGISIEMAARELRYSWFAGLCAGHGYKAVAVAHNANDNAETLLLNLVRGTGLKGISGMSEAAVMPYSGDAPVLLLRPLLQFTRKQIEGHVFANRVPYRNDSTNAQSEYKRNSIRNEVFPLLGRLNPSFVRTFNREMSYFSEADDIVSDWCASAASSVVSAAEGGAVSVNLKKLVSYRHWRYLLYYILEPFGFNSAALASVEELVSSGRTVSGKRFMSASHILYTGRGVLDVYPMVALPDRPSDTGPDEEEIRIEGPGVYNFTGVSFSVDEFERPQDFVLKQPAGVLVMDADLMKFPFLCRKWRAGDWMIPLGM
ncbi:MAG: tRNA lysidine(34) synthetase TilS, partial [Bacteroidaceae bacterium]|nr:tRNA lysidine(34) synthetase TilS [Bacteroidaceae bacterium]